MTLGFLKKRRQPKFTDKSELIKALHETNGAAIRSVASKIRPDVRKVALNRNLSEEDVEELVHDALMVLISAIQEGRFKDQGYHPAAYAVGVAKKLIANRVRSLKGANLELEEVQLLSDLNPETYLENKERRSIIEKLLLQLGETCRKLIQFKFFEGLRDKEIIEQQLLAFSTTNSLKSKRNQCMKKLGKVAQSAGIKTLV